MSIDAVPSSLSMAARVENYCFRQALELSFKFLKTNKISEFDWDCIELYKSFKKEFGVVIVLWLLESSYPKHTS